MASLDTLSDAEIRTKLCDLGCEIGPVTPSTRRVYIKKLQSLIENGDSSTKSNQSKDSKPAPAPPSPEESIFKNRSKSTGQSRNKSPSRAAQLNPLASSTFVDGSPIRTNSVKHTVSSDIRSAPAATRDGTPPEKRVSSSTNFSSSSDDTLPYKPSYNLPGYSSSKYNSPPYLSGASSYRPKLSNFDPDQPYASDFTRRLSNSSVSRIAAQTGTSPRSPSSNSKIYDNVKESDDEDDNQGPIYSAKMEHSARSQKYHRGNGQVYPTQGVLFGKDASVYIVGFFALFFLAIAYIYVQRLHTSDGKVQDLVAELAYPKCNGLSEHCVPVHEISKATTVFKLICSELNEMAAKSSCSDTVEPKLCNKEASRVVNARDGSLSVFELDRYIYYAKILAESNPSKNIIYSDEGFKLRELPTSFFCSIVKHTMSLTVWFFRLLIGLIVGVSVYAGVKWWMARRSKHQEEVMKLFGQIIDLVSSTATHDGPGFAVVSHIRDRIIPATDKTSKMKIWDEAVALLEGDSRVRTEVQQVEGEDFLVWRWLAPPPNPKRKVWQGQAFETMDGSVNSLPESPTSCLKIRHMFDPSQEEGDIWVNAVADAILEKCKDAAIYHIVVEKQSPEGCVYVKCASPRDAGIAYRALHGFWFDSKLVTVKYIREARYLERFPDSARAKYPLIPSSKRHH